jgi:hypothetical protein
MSNGYEIVEKYMNQSHEISKSQASRLFKEYKNGSNDSSVWDGVKSDVLAIYEKLGNEPDTGDYRIPDDDEQMHYEFHQNVLDCFNAIFSGNTRDEFGNVEKIDGWEDAVAWLFSNGFGSEYHRYDFTKFSGVPFRVFELIPDWTNKVVAKFAQDDRETLIEDYFGGSSDIDIHGFKFFARLLDTLPEDEQKKHRENIKLSWFFNDDVDANISMFKEYEAIIKSVVVNDNVTRRRFAWQISGEIYYSRPYVEEETRNLVTRYFDEYARDRFYVPLFEVGNNNFKSFLSDISNSFEDNKLKMNFMNTFRHEFGGDKSSIYQALIESVGNVEKK